jgi:hypothetical protein
VDTKVSEEHTTSIFRSEDGGSIFPLNVSAHLQFHMVSQPKRPPLISNTVKCIKDIQIDCKYQNPLNVSCAAKL